MTDIHLDWRITNHKERDMDYNEINFNKQNRRPVTDTTYQIAAEEWNALGDEIERQGDVIEILEEGGGLEFITNAEIQAILNQ